MFANSTWTRNALLEVNDKLNVSVIYPPVNLELFKAPDIHVRRENLLMSCSQFRPEKNQARQLDIIAQLKKKTSETFKFCMCGSVTSADTKVLTSLMEKRNHLGLEDVVEFCPNLTKDELQLIMSRSKASINTMEDEHFGIALVEQMAAGAVVVSHASGGAKEDILHPDDDGVSPGYLCISDEEFVSSLAMILKSYNIVGSETYNKRIVGQQILEKRFNSDERFIRMILRFFPKTP